MYKSVWIWLLLIILTQADVTMKQTKYHDDEAGIPEHPIHRPERPIHRPPYHHPDYVPTGLYEKDAYIEQLLSELAVLRAKEQQRLSEKLKKEHEAELKKFEERKSSIKTKNTIIIKEKAAQ